MPIGGEPSPAENAALAAALNGYAVRSGPDDFSSLTGFLDRYPHSPWSAALLTGLGKEYYNTAHYSLALEAWRQAWTHAKEARDAKGLMVMNRAVSELAYLYARLGRTTELEALLKSLEGRTFSGEPAQKIVGAREALWTMRNQPEVAFRCGPLALHRIKLATDPQHPATEAIFNSASTPNGIALPDVAELSRKVGLDYQMAFRKPGAPFIVPSVVHWKAGHYAALTKQVDDRFLVEDPTFGNTVWPTRQALEAETSGYFLVPAGPLPSGWRRVDAQEGTTVWGKGKTSNNDKDVYTPQDEQTTDCKEGGDSEGMAISSVHLMLANLQVRDMPLGYTPPVGPPVRFTVRYNHRGAPIPGNPSNLGGWTCDWFACINDNPQSPMADVKYYVGGGGARTFTGFNSSSQTYAFQQFDQTLLKRTSTNSYELLLPDGSRKIFAQSDGSVGTSRNIYLSQVLDPQGNAVTLSYDTNLLLTAITDAIGQVTTLRYGMLHSQYSPNDYLTLTNVTDPFGRSATFDYDLVQVGDFYTIVNGVVVKDTPIYQWFLARITDVLGLTSSVTYASIGISLETQNETLYTLGVRTLITPYGTNTFSVGNGPSTNSTMRYVETLFPDGSRERVEYNQDTSVFNAATQTGGVPTGMATDTEYLTYRNTYYWSRVACATAYGDYSKARLYHWLHTADLASTAGILESTKPALENRVWYDYPGQGGSFVVGSSNKPRHVGRVLDDGSTQLYTYAYNGLGHLTSQVDPVGRTFTYIYDTNGIDLLEVRQTRAGKNELLTRRTYNSQHRPLTIVDTAGQTNSFTWNARGQLLTATNPKREITTCTYDASGYLLAVDGPLPGTNDTVSASYDAYGRVHTLTDLSGYTLSVEYDALDRRTRITYPDGTFTQYAFDLLNLASIQDRAGRVTRFERNNMRQITRMTDPLGRVYGFDWCHCGALRSLIDPLGRKTTWHTDVQARPIGKQYADGSQVTYVYENTTSRLRQVIDEKQQTTVCTYNLDNSLRSTAYLNSAVPTPGVTYTYDPEYERLTSVTDSTGTTLYSYIPITATPGLGAGRLASMDGPLPNDTIIYAYDELGRLVHRAINGVDSVVAYDAAGRTTAATNALGSFFRTYDGSSRRVLSETFPNGQGLTRAYDPVLEDLQLQRITWVAGATPLSEFLYNHNPSRGEITRWSQQAGVQAPDVYSFTYDNASQLVAATVTNSGVEINAFGYSYDPAANRLTEQAGGTSNTSTYNALNQLSTSTARSASRTNEWDAANRLVAVSDGNQRTEFTYDGQGRMVGIRQLLNGLEISHRLFVWDRGQLCEERDTKGGVVKRFFAQGVRIETGANPGNYYYSRDHLQSIREVVDAGGTLRARYAYDPFGRRTKLSGDLEADFGFAGMFWSSEANLALARFRAYDPVLGRWLNRDPIGEAGDPNLYAYARENPVRWTDPLGLDGNDKDTEEHLKEIVEWGENVGYQLHILAGLNELFEWEADWGLAAEGFGTFIGTGLKAAEDIVHAVQCPDGNHILAATFDIELTIAVLRVPGIGLPIAAAEFLDDLTGGPINMVRITEWQQKQIEAQQRLQQEGDEGLQRGYEDSMKALDQIGGP